MKRAFLGGLALALLVAACAQDPTADLGPATSRISVQYDSVTLAVGDSLIVSAQTVDGQNVALASMPVPASASTAIATVLDAYLPPLPIARFWIKGISKGTTTVNLTAEGATASIDVVVN